MVISGCLLLHFAQIDHAKTSSFYSFQDNNLKIAAQFPLKKNNKSMVFATLSQKRCLKKQTQKHGFSKTPKLPVVDEYLANYKHSWTWSKKPPENKRHTPRGGRRTCYLVVVVVIDDDDDEDEDGINTGDTVMKSMVESVMQMIKTMMKNRVEMMRWC